MLRIVPNWTQPIAIGVMPMEKVCIDTVESGEMTRDFAILIRADHRWLATNQFLDKLDTNLQKAMAS